MKTTEQKAKKYDEALEWMRKLYPGLHGATKEDAEHYFPELKEGKDERIIEQIKFAVMQMPSDREDTKKECLAWLEKQKESPKSADSIPSDCVTDAKCENLHNEEGDFVFELRQIISSHRYSDIYGEYINDEEAMASEILELCKCELEKQKEQKPIKMEVCEVGKGTTICGQDYKCKKDYKEGNCWYIKDVIYHCSRDGYLNDQNGVSWSCTPEWFNEYIYTNSEWADEEKKDFVGGQFSNFIQCKLSFDEFKEGEHYWLEYIGDDTYIGRSDNILNQKFHITPRQLYSLFSQQLDVNEEEQKPITINQDEKEFLADEITAFLCNYDKEFDGEDPVPSEVAEHFYLLGKQAQEQKPAEWSAEDKETIDLTIAVLKENLPNGYFKTNPANTLNMGAISTDELINRLKSLSPQPKVKWSEEDEKMRNLTIEWAETMSGQLSFVDMVSTDFRKIIAWLKSLCPQSKDEIYKEKNEAFKLGKHQLAIKFMNYLDENRPEGKMSLSNGECEDIDKAFKENDWAKIIQYVKKYQIQAEQKPAEVDEYKIIKKHITEDSLSSEVNKRLTECGWYVTDEKPVERSEEDEMMLIKVKQIILKYWNYHKYDDEKKDAESCYNWLKSLKDRGNFPKSNTNSPSEWSEDIVRRGIKEVGLTQHQIDWLKNNVFPPKEEQEPETKLTGWVARDKEFDSYYGTGLILYSKKPRRSDNCWNGDIVMQLPWQIFPDLKWVDPPMEVEITIRKK